MPVTRKGTTPRQSLSTRRSLLSATTSMANNMPNVCTPDEGLMRSPHPESSRLLPTNPIRRVRDVSAIVIRVPTVVALVMFLRLSAERPSRSMRLCLRVLSAIYDEGKHGYRQNARYDPNDCCRIHGCFLLSSHLRKNCRYHPQTL